MMSTLGKIRLSAVLANLMCAAILAPTVILSAHLVATCHDRHSDCPDKPLLPHQSHQCSICLTIDTVMGKSLCPAPIVACGAVVPVLSFIAKCSDVISGLYQHTKISRAPPST